MHPLQIASLLSWVLLLLAQLYLLLPATAANAYWAGLLVILLLIPARGLFNARRYTYKWIGFLTMFYFCIGIAELVSRPDMRLYGFTTTLASLGLFLSSIYFARYLGVAKPEDPAARS